MNPGATKAAPKTRRSRPDAKLRKGRRPGRKPYPILSFEQALRFGYGVAEVGAGHPVKRATLFEKLNLPVNQATRDLITASSKYGITNGAHNADEFSLTTEGAKAVEPAASSARNRARIKLAITDIEPFQRLYEKFQGGKMHAIEAMRDTLEDLNEGDRTPCVDIFVQNAKFVGILQTREGAEFFASADDAAARTDDPTKLSTSSASTPANMPFAGEDYDTVCFFHRTDRPRRV
jgi:hypothetical protein